ncbi:WGR domain-containing protein [Limnobaculum zhutongyuii]|uniref:WGR domain-containing protein n=1 Tax=Limnobaculum zhutongyuii TaxID=2498113 RepID=A0A411WJJ0_9GAMM|nr:WGR domain-containing protein [Limnobaculum zhutongyuii]QBH96365.1 WGR domain-containing protein [Limnobaculum zhutongyuii]TQS86661.1 WGR domain-containing protein [Limnobaculum zhutongyuii]
MKRTFIYNDDKSAKFWTIDIDSNSFRVNFGKLNTEGQNQTKTFDNAAGCQKQADKLIKEKLKKGYVEQLDGSQSTDSASTNNGKTKNSTTFKILMEGDNAQPASFIVDITNPDSISAVLNYQIDNFDEFKDLVQKYDHEYGYLNSNGEYVCFSDDLSSSEETFLKAAIEFKQLHPILKKYVDKIIEANLGGQLLYSNQYKQELEQPTYQYIKLLTEAYQQRGIFYSVSWRKNKEYYGIYVAGALACFGEQYEDDILTFLDLILTYDNDSSNKTTILNSFRYIIGKTKPNAKLPKIKEKYGIKNW